MSKGTEAGRDGRVTVRILQLTRKRETFAEVFKPECGQASLGFRASHNDLGFWVNKLHMTVDHSELSGKHSATTYEPPCHLIAY